MKMLMETWVVQAGDNGAVEKSFCLAIEIPFTPFVGLDVEWRGALMTIKSVMWIAGLPYLLCTIDPHIASEIRGTCSLEELLLELGFEEFDGSEFPPEITSAMNSSPQEKESENSSIDLIRPNDVDRLLLYPRGRALRLAKAGKIPFITLPDGSIRFKRWQIEGLLHSKKVRTKINSPLLDKQKPEI